MSDENLRAAERRLAVEQARMGIEVRQVTIRGAWRDLNAKGKGVEAFRKVWRGGSWRWVSSEYLPKGTYLAADRRAEVDGAVRIGEIVVEFSRRLPDRHCTIDRFWVVEEFTGKDGGPKKLRVLASEKRVEGYRLTLPSGSLVDVPDPLVRS